MSMCQPWARRWSRSAIVALVPGIRTRSASPGRGCPASTMRSVTPGSADSGSRSSKLAIRLSRGTTILNAPAVGPEARSSTSSAGRRQASSNQGTRPRAGQPVRVAISSIPASNRLGSPRNRFTAKPLIRAASPSLRTACVPTICAMTPPRSMSPTRMTGMSAASAKPMLARSPARRLISAGLPAPSITTRSASAASRAKLSRIAPMSRGFSRA